MYRQNSPKIRNWLESISTFTQHPLTEQWSVRAREDSADTYLLANVISWSNLMKEPKFQTTTAYLFAAVRKNHPTALHLMSNYVAMAGATHNENGNKIRNPQKERLPYLRRAIQAGSSEACFYYADFLEENPSYTLDENEETIPAERKFDFIADLYLRAGRGGISAAYQNLAALIENKKLEVLEGNPITPELVYSFLKRASRSCDDAFSKLGFGLLENDFNRNEYGEIIPSSDVNEIAKRMFIRAMKANFALAFLNYGTFVYQEIFCLDENDQPIKETDKNEVAHRLWCVAAEKESEALNNIGYLLLYTGGFNKNERGETIPQETRLSEAERIFVDAKRKGSPSAFVNLTVLELVKSCRQSLATKARLNIFNKIKEILNSSPDSHQKKFI